MKKCFNGLAISFIMGLDLDCGSRSTIHGSLNVLNAFMAFSVGLILLLYPIFSISPLILINLNLHSFTFVIFILQLEHALRSTI